MVRHYCDICQKEIEGYRTNVLILELKGEDNMLLGRELLVDGCINNELCGTCAKKIALYVMTKCKEEEHE